MSDRLNHRLALHAQQAVEKVSQGNAEKAKEYRSFCEGFPALLRTAGLLQTLAFLKAKDKSPHGLLLADLTSQFRTLGLLQEKEDLVIRVASLSTSDYLAWTRLADRSAQWHKRFAQALIHRAKEGG